MLRRTLISRAARTACAAISLSLLANAQAETLVYDGSNPDLLQEAPNGVKQSLFPGGASDNTVTFSGGTIGGDVVGAHVGTGNARNNTVNFNAGQTDKSVFGAYVANGDASNNTVNITGGTVAESVRGAMVTNGNASHNTINIAGGNIGTDVFGVHVGNGDASSNTVNITGGTVAQSLRGAMVTNGNASHNTVNVAGGSIGTRLYGAYIIADGDATNNTVNILGGTIVGDVRAGYVSGSGNASNNTVNIAGGQISGSVHSAIIGVGNANSNTVTVTGGNIAGDIVGGLTSSGDAVNNTVTVGAGATLAPTTQISGGIASGDAFTGNTLNLGYSGTLNSIRNFEFYHFVIPDWMRNGDTQVTTSNAVALNDTHITVGLAGGGSALRAGDTVTLLSNTSGDPASFSSKGQKGISLLYDVSLAQANPSLQATFSDPTINPQTKSLIDGRIGQTVVTNMAGDLVAGQGMRNALTATQGARALSVFGAINGTAVNVDGGATLDVNATTLLLGAGKRSGPWMLGGFVEAGAGNYDTSRHFSDAASVTASGNADFYGVGVLGRYDFSDSRHGAYADASLRLGRTSLSYASGDLCDVNGQCASYDNKVNYVGGHVGGGYVLPLNTRTELNFSSSYRWSRLAASAVDVVGDPIMFNAIRSSRLRHGLRLDYTLANGVTPYVGTAYEYEFDAKANATAYNMDMTAPSLKGGTTVAEAGMHWRRNDVHITLALQGYFGKRSGPAAQLAAEYSF